MGAEPADKVGGNSAGKGVLIRNLKFTIFN
jgi:hypothetical protein